MVYKEHVRIDLHIHSTASDGTLSPSEILSLAQDLGLGAIAITDHDSIGGSQEALALGIPSSFKFLTGVELSASPPPSFPHSGSLHILGYAIRLDDPILNQTLDKLKKARLDRNPQIIERLNKLGIDISMSEVMSEVGGDGLMGRPHIATVMVKNGFAESINDAFNKYLGTGKPAYVDKYRVDCTRAIEIILGAGGIPVLAHPVLLKNNDNDLFESLVRCLRKIGLKGIEVYYPDNTPELTAYYADIANRYDLLMTGGTDFHGSLKPDIKMGSGKSDLFVPYELYENLMHVASPNTLHARQTNPSG